MDSRSAAKEIYEWSCIIVHWPRGVYYSHYCLVLFLHLLQTSAVPPVFRFNQVKKNNQDLNIRGQDLLKYLK